MQNLENQLEEAFKKVTSETCNKIIRKIRQVEDKFWTEDAKMDRLWEKENVGQFLEMEKEEKEEQFD